MKILITQTNLQVGGVTKVLINYIRLLCAHHRVHLLVQYDCGINTDFVGNIAETCSHEFVFSAEQFKQKISCEKNRRSNLRNRLKHKLLKYNERKKLKNKFQSLIESERFDLIIDFCGDMDFIFRHKVIPHHLAPTIRWVHTQLNGASNITKKQRKKYKNIFNNHTKIVTLCPQMAEILQTELNIPPSKFFTLFNPIDTQKILELAQESIPEKLTQSPYLLQVSRLAQGKGHEQLLKIFYELKKKGLPHKLVFVGEGENRFQLEHLIKYYNLHDECILLGEKLNPYPYFRHADLFVHTSEYEGLSIVIMESMALSTPVVAMDCATGPRDIIGKNDDYGKLVPLYNEELFIQAVLGLTQNQEMYQHYVNQGLIRIQDFSLNTISVRLNQLIHELALKSNDSSQVN